jgi:hypothetical protein
MATLEDKISDLEAEIAKSTARLDEAITQRNEAKEERLDNLIIASRNNLHDLYQQLQGK